MYQRLTICAGIALLVLTAPGLLGQRASDCPFPVGRYGHQSTMVRVAAADSTLFARLDSAALRMGYVRVPATRSPAPIVYEARGAWPLGADSAEWVGRPFPGLRIAIYWTKFNGDMRLVIGATLLCVPPDTTIATLHRMAHSEADADFSFDTVAVPPKHTLHQD